MFQFKVVPCLILFLQFFSTKSLEVREVRLVNGSSELEGRLEIMCNGMWLSVCQDSIDDSYANRLCQTLGYAGSGAVRVGPETFGSGTRSATTDIDDCTGVKNNCNHVGLICSTAQCQDWNVDIGTTSTRVCLGHTWKYIEYCSSTANITSSFICRQAGYSSYGSFSIERVTSSQGQLSTLQCLGNETHLSECSQESCSVGSSNLASRITCKPRCHLCNNMSSKIEVYKVGPSTLQLEWSFRNITYKTFDYYIANCSTTTKQGNTPMHSASKVITSPLASSVEITGIDFQYYYICCITARQKQHSSYVVCSPMMRFSVGGGGISNFLYTINGIFFYLFFFLLLIIVIIVAVIIIACICSRKKRKFITRKQNKKITADLNKVFSQSLLSINEKVKKENMDAPAVSTSISTKFSSDDPTSSKKRSDELVKSLPVKVDKEKKLVEYSTLVRIDNKIDENTLRTSPCVAYGAVTDSASGQSKTSLNEDYTNINESPKEKSMAAASQYYEDVS